MNYAPRKVLHVDVQREVLLRHLNFKSFLKDKFVCEVNNGKDL